MDFGLGLGLGLRLVNKRYQEFRDKLQSYRCKVVNEKLTLVGQEAADTSWPISI